MRESNTKFSLSQSLKTDQPSYLRSLLSFPSHHCTRSSSLTTLSRPFLTSRLKIANRTFYHSAPVLWNNLPSHPRQVVHHVTPPISNSPVSYWSTSLFLNKLKPSLSLFLSSLVCIHLGYLRSDWYLRYWPSFVFSSHTHFAIIHRHISHPIFMLFDL